AIWGSGLFQSADPVHPSVLGALPLMPEWYLIIAGLAAGSLLGIIWRPLLLALPLLVLAVGALLFHAATGGARAARPYAADGRLRRMKRCTLTQLLHLLQPLARLSGRIGHGLTPWRRRTVVTRRALPWWRART